MGCGSSKAVTVVPDENPDVTNVSQSSNHSTITLSHQSANTVTSLSAKTTTASHPHLLLPSPDQTTFTQTLFTNENNDGPLYNPNIVSSSSSPSATNATNPVHHNRNDTYENTVTVDANPQINVNNNPPHPPSVHQQHSNSNSNGTGILVPPSISRNIPVSDHHHQSTGTNLVPESHGLSILSSSDTSVGTTTVVSTTVSSSSSSSTPSSNLSSTTSTVNSTTIANPSSPFPPPFIPPLLLHQERQSSDTSRNSSKSSSNTGFIGRFIESTRRASLTMLGLGSIRHLNTGSNNSPVANSNGGGSSTRNLFSSSSDQEKNGGSTSTTTVRSTTGISPQSSLSKLFSLGKSSTSLSPLNNSATNTHSVTGGTTTPFPLKKEGSEPKRTFLGYLTGNRNYNHSNAPAVTSDTPARTSSLPKPRSIYQPTVYASTIQSNAALQTSQRTDSTTELFRSQSLSSQTSNSDYYRSFSNGPGGNSGGGNGSNNNSQVIEVNKEIKVKDEAGNKRVNHFLMMEVIGRGAYGKVRKCLDEETGMIRAVKIIRKSLMKRKRVGRFGNAFESVQREMAIWKKLEHPYVLKLFEIVDDETSDKLYMVGEYINGGPIMPDERVCEAIPLQDAQRYMAMLTDGLAYLHFQKVVHRDIKPGNLLIDREQKILRISDFGVSQVHEEEDDNIRSTAGTAPFLAPEMLTGGHFSGRIADIWAVGITLYMFIYGTTPFVADRVPDIYENIRTKTVEWPNVTALGKPLEMNAIEPAKDLVMRLLDRNPDTRISIEDIRMHPFVRAANIPVVPLPLEPIEVTELEIMNAISNVVKLRAVIKASLVAKRSLARVRTKLKLNAALAFADGLDHRRSGKTVKDEDDDEQDVQTIEHVDMLDSHGNVVSKTGTDGNPTTTNKHHNNNLNTSTSSTVIMNHLGADQVIKEEEGSFEQDELSSNATIIPTPVHRSAVSTTTTNRTDDTTKDSIPSSPPFPAPLDKSDTFKIKAVASFTGLETTHPDTARTAETNSSPGPTGADNSSHDDGTNHSQDGPSEVSDTESYYARTEDSQHTLKDHASMSPVSPDRSSATINNQDNVEEDNNSNNSPVAAQLGPGVPRYRLYVAPGESRSAS